MSRQPRFEIVRTAAGWHARLRARNGRIVWTTEVYRRQSAATNAIDLFGFYIGGGTAFLNSFPVEVREVDER